MTPIACSRMYDVTPTAKTAWTRLFDRVSRAAGVDLVVVDHPAPLPLASLWTRDDMACVFMCGWPFSRAEPKPRLVAAPIPAGERYGGRPVYVTDFIVRGNSGFSSLSDTFGGRIAWTDTASHSGFNAPRHHLLSYRTAARRRLYRDSVGPVLSPSGALESVLSGAADVAPMDSYALDLIRRHEPERVADIVVVDTTAAAPIPPLVASPGMDRDSCDALRRALLMVHRDPQAVGILSELGLVGFSAVDAESYRVARDWECAALEAGYDRPA